MGEHLSGVVIVKRSRRAMRRKRGSSFMQPGTSYRYVELLALALLPLLVEAERVSTYMICLVFVCKLHVQFIFVY